MTPRPPAEGRISNPFGAIIYDTSSAPIYRNRWGFHLGIDIAVPVATPVRAAASGVVEHAGPDHLLGYHVVIGHPAGWRTLYAHLDRLDVAAGDGVYGGRIIGLSGNTGLSTGPHLHFETWARCSRLGGNLYDLTRGDGTAIPLDPAPIWQGRWPDVTGEALPAPERTRVPVLIGGQEVGHGYLVDDITYVDVFGRSRPLRPLAEALGYQVEWRDGTVHLS